MLNVIFLCEKKIQIISICAESTLPEHLFLTENFWIETSDRNWSLSCGALFLWNCYFYGHHISTIFSPRLTGWIGVPRPASGSLHRSPHTSAHYVVTGWPAPWMPHALGHKYMIAPDVRMFQDISVNALLDWPHN